MMQYLALLKKCNLRQRLRDAREAMSEEFPLPEALWKEWISDELKEVTRYRSFPQPIQTFHKENRTTDPIVHRATEPSIKLYCTGLSIRSSHGFAN